MFPILFVFGKLFLFFCAGYGAGKFCKNNIFLLILSSLLLFGTGYLICETEKQYKIIYEELQSYEDIEPIYPADSFLGGFRANVNLREE